MFPPILSSGQSLREGLRRPPVPILKLADPVSSASPSPCPRSSPSLPSPPPSYRSSPLRTRTYPLSLGRPSAPHSAHLPTLCWPNPSSLWVKEKEASPFRLGKEVSATPCPRDFPQGGAEAEREKKAESAPLLYGQPKCGGLKSPSKASSVSSPPLPAFAYHSSPYPLTGSAETTNPAPTNAGPGEGKASDPCHWRLDHNRGNCFKTNYWEPSAVPGIQR